MTRVLFLTESFHPVMGGGETHIRRLGSALVAAGDQVTVVTRRHERCWPTREELDGMCVLRVPPCGPGRVGKYLMVPSAFRAVVREASRHDVVVVRGTRVLGLPGLLAARWRGLSAVMQPEINGELGGEAFTWGRRWGGGGLGRLVAGAMRLRNPWLRDAERFVAMSRQIAAEMRAAGVEAHRIVHIPHGVDTQRFRPAAGSQEVAGLRAALGLPDGVLAIYTGRLLRGKGLETLFDGLAIAGATRPWLRLVIVGSGQGQWLSVEADLRRRAERPDLVGRVFFAGASDRVEEWLRASDVFVFPSLYEALGISLIEAAACGLACIGSRTGGIVDVIEDGRSGRLVPPADAQALAVALAAWADDESGRRSMGHAARREALTRFDERDSIARYRALFAEISPSGVSRPGRAAREGAGRRPSPAARA